MDSSIIIKRVNKDDVEILNELEGQFYDLYKSMEDKKLILKITENGGSIWRKSIESALNKTHLIVVALKNNKPVGFTWGQVNFCPSYLGSLLIGKWIAIYTEPNSRNLGISKQLFLEIEKWFIEKRVHSIEGQMLIENVHSLNGVLNMGFEKELYQTRKILRYE